MEFKQARLKGAREVVWKRQDMPERQEHSETLANAIAQGKSSRDQQGSAEDDSASKHMEEAAKAQNSARYGLQQSCCFQVEEVQVARVLVMYSYYETPRAIHNLRFFLHQTRRDWAPTDSGRPATWPRLELVLVISGHACSVPLPSAPNVRVLRVDNSGSDFGGYCEALEYLGISLIELGWRQLFTHFVFINSSCRGPFMPSYASNIHWTEPFTSKITLEVKLVGPSIHFIPGAALLSRTHSPTSLHAEVVFPI